MKKPIISAILLLSLLFGLCGCKAGGKNGDGTIALSDYSGDSPTFERRDICLEGYEFTSVGDMFYDGENTVYIASSQDDVETLFRLDLETEEVTDLGYETACSIWDFDVTPDGTLMTLELDMDKEKTMLKEISQDGELIRELDVDAVAMEAVGPSSNGDTFLNHLTCLEDEILFLAANGAFTTDYNGKLLQSVEAMMYPLGIYRNADGKAVLYGRDADGYLFCEYDGDLKNMEKTKLDCGDPWLVPHSALDGYGSKGLYLTAKTDIVSLDYHTGEAELVVDSTTDTHTGSIAFISPDKFITSEHTAYVDDEPTNICSIWERVADDDTTVLKMATYGVGYETSEMVSQFNAQSDNVKIKLVNYSTYDLSGESGEGLTKLNTEIIAGDIPDLFDLGALYEDTYANKGLLEDLTPWLDGPEGPGRNQLVEPVMSALEREDGLYSIPAYFKVSTVAGSSELLSGEGWTPEEFLAFAEEHGADKMFSSQMTGEYFMDYVITFTAEDYMDRDAGTCDFDNESFINMLKFAAKLSAEEPSDYDGQTSDIASGRCLLMLRFTGDPVADLEMWNALFGGEAVHKGFPSTHGTGICARVSNRVGMSSASQHKDEAWAFISWMLSGEFQGQLHERRGIPMSAAQMEHDFRQVIEKSNGQPETWVIYIDDVPTDLACAPASEDTYNEAMSLINRIDCIDQCDGNIRKIVMEECSYLFSGAKTAEETARLIQERVSLYMAEQG